MSLLLNVPYAEKDEAKALGARWNPRFKKWCAVNKQEYYKFRKWYKNKNTDLILLDHFYIIISEQRCLECQNSTPMISLVSDSYIMMEKERFQMVEKDINFIQDPNNLPEPLEKYLKENHKFYYDHPKTSRTNYFGNHCHTCGMLQQKFSIYSQLDSPFMIDSVPKAESLNVLKIKLQFDLEMSGTVIWISCDHLIREHAKISNFNLDL